MAHILAFVLVVNDFCDEILVFEGDSHTLLR